MVKLGTQLHVGSVDSVESLRFEIKNRFSTKPQGAFWTSTYRGGRSAWVEWCEGEHFCLPDDGVWRGVLLEPLETARVAVVDSLTDLHRLLEQYEQEPPYEVDRSFMRYLDFERMAQDFDALHLTERGLGETHWADIMTLYGWDCESTCWFRPAFRIVGRVEIPVSAEPDDWEW